MTTVREKKGAGWVKGQSGNPAGRKKGVPVKKTQALDAVKKVFGTEAAFWEAIATKAKDGDAIMVKELAGRILPPLKPRSSTVELKPAGESTKDFAQSVLQGVSEGRVPADEASSILNALLSADKLTKLDELEKKIDSLLEARNANH
jgi:hypothetical protein